MFPAGGAKHLFGQDPAQNTVVIQCRHDKQHMLTRASIRQRASALGRAPAGKPGKAGGPGAAGGPAANPEYVVFHRGASLDPATARIDRGDFVFQMGGGRRANTGGLLDSALPVLSSLNDAFVRRDRFTAAELELGEDMPDDVLADRLSEEINGIGFSLGSTNPAAEDEGSRKEQITTRVQGTMDIFNNGTSCFRPGDVILWKIPSRDEIASAAKRFGHSPQKVTPVLVPLRHAHDQYSLSKHVRRLLNSAAGPDRAAGLVRDDHGAAGPRSRPMGRLGFSVVKLMVAAILSTNPNLQVTAHMADDYAAVLVGNTGAAQNLDAPTIEYLRQAFDGMFNGNNHRHFEAMVDDTLLRFFEIQEDVRRRTVGVSMQSGKPGQKFTALLGQS